MIQQLLAETQPTPREHIMTLSSCSSSLRLNFISLVRDIIARGGLRWIVSVSVGVHTSGQRGNGWLTHSKRSPERATTFSLSSQWITTVCFCLCCFYRKLISTMFSAIKVFPLPLSVRLRLSRTKGNSCIILKLVSRGMFRPTPTHGLLKAAKNKNCGIVNQFVAGSERLGARLSLIESEASEKFIYILFTARGVSIT